MNMKKYSIAIAGTTHRTAQCAQALLESPLFDVSWVLTPVAKPIGRKQIVTPNQMEEFATKNNISTVFVKTKITSEIKTQLQELSKPDFLLVVDFGYIIPDWLLEIPKICPLNIHPSQLPKWRGSSPGQFSILFNDQESAVTLMIMNKKLDQGPVIHQDLFKIDKNWNSEDYYKHAFNLMCENLDNKIADFAEKYTKSETREHSFDLQPNDSPTITARTIKKDQTFVPFELVLLALSGLEPNNLQLKNLKLSNLLLTALEENNSLAVTLERATKAFTPWPNLWTIINTKQGEKRMKLLKTSISNNKLELETVQIEGKNPTNWDDIKNYIS